MSVVNRSVDHLFRRQAGQMVSTLTRIFGPRHLDLVEDMVQEAFVQALRKWPYHGEPANPAAWLIQVAKNRALDLLRRDRTWEGKRGEIESRLASLSPAGDTPDTAFARELRDDQLRMIFMCCGPRLSRDARVALTLKTVGGFSISEIARAFLARETTIAQRIVRAKRKLREERVQLSMPPPGELPARLDSVLEVLYLLFNEGYSALEGDDLVRRDLCDQAIYLAHLLTDHEATRRPEVHALAALFALQAARTPARADAAGDLLLLREQDRGLWDRRLLDYGVRQLEAAAVGDQLTRYHLEAEIALCHSLAGTWAETDWAKILRCYDALHELAPSPVVRLNRAVALAQVEGPAPALRAIAELEESGELSGYYPLFATRGVLLADEGRSAEAAVALRAALDLASSRPVRRFLQHRLSQLP